MSQSNNLLLSTSRKFALSFVNKMKIVYSPDLGCFLIKSWNWIRHQIWLPMYLLSKTHLRMLQIMIMIHYCWIECVLVTANKAAEGRSVLEYDDVMQFAVLCPPTKYLDIQCRGSCEERNLIRASHQLITEPHEHRHRWQYLHKTFRGYKVGVYNVTLSCYKYFLYQIFNFVKPCTRPYIDIYYDSTVRIYVHTFEKAFSIRIYLLNIIKVHHSSMIFRCVFFVTWKYFLAS